MKATGARRRDTLWESASGTIIHVTGKAVKPETGSMFPSISGVKLGEVDTDFPDFGDGLFLPVGGRKGCRTLARLEAEATSAARNSHRESDTGRNPVLAKGKTGKRVRSWAKLAADIGILLGSFAGGSQPQFPSSSSESTPASSRSSR